MVKENMITENLIRFYSQHLLEEEKSTATMEKNLRDVRMFHAYNGETYVTKERVMNYKKNLQKK